METGMLSVLSTDEEKRTSNYSEATLGIVLDRCRIKQVSNYTFNSLTTDSMSSTATF